MNLLISFIEIPKQNEIIRQIYNTPPITLVLHVHVGDMNDKILLKMAA